MKRISVIGSSAAGKSTMARALADRLGLRYLELDSVFHQPGWRPKPDEAFRAEVAEFARAKKWVIDGNYTSHAVAAVVWPLADTIVWMDPPRSVVMRRVIRRTVRRVVTREELWNGNREPWSNLFNLRPERNIVVWTWTRFTRTREKYEQARADGTWNHLQVHRLRTPEDSAAFLSSIRG